jgi:ABC-2 type transport system permease protein
MRTLIVIIQKEFKQILRNPATIKLIFVMPILQLIILPNAADYEIKNINLHIIDHDHSALSRRLTENIRATGYFRIEGYGTDRKAARHAIETEKADIILNIPASFERNLVREGKSGLMIEVNAINGVKGGMGAAYMNSLIHRFNSDIRTEWTGDERFMQAGTIGTTSSFWFNPEMNYSFFMVPGILVLLLTIVAMNLTSINIVREKEIGTIEQINVSPIRKYEFILGKLVPQFILGMVAMTLGFGIARLFYGIVPMGSYLTIYLFAAVYMFTILGIGLLVSNYSATQQQAMLASFFIMMIFVLMSGQYTSIDSMPEWAKWIARVNPVTYFIEVMRRVVLKGAGPGDILPELGIMSAYALLTNSLAVFSYHKRS